MSAFMSSKDSLYILLSKSKCLSIISRLLRWEFIKENKNIRKQEDKNLTKKKNKKRRKFFLFFLVEFLFSCFLDRVLVFFFAHKVPRTESESLCDQQ